MKRFLTTALSAALLTTLATAALAVPGTLPYQGRLTDAAGTPINGTRPVTFAMYAAATGGSALWTEIDTLTVANGLFSVNLGGVTAFPGGLFNSPALFLGIKVATDPEMTPRQSVGSGAFAQHSVLADQATTATTATSASSATTSADAGGFSNNTTSASVTVTAAAPIATLATVVLTAPVAGYALVTGGGSLYFTHTVAQVDNYFVNVSTSPTTVPTGQGYNVLRMDSNAPSTAFAVFLDYSCTNVFPVVAGANTFYLNAQRENGANATAYIRGITAIFLPKLYGTAAIPASAPPASTGPASTLVSPSTSPR